MKGEITQKDFHLLEERLIKLFAQFSVESISLEQLVVGAYIQGGIDSHSKSKNHSIKILKEIVSNYYEQRNN